MKPATPAPTAPAAANRLVDATPAAANAALPARSEAGEWTPTGWNPPASLMLPGALAAGQIVPASSGASLSAVPVVPAVADVWPPAANPWASSVEAIVESVPAASRVGLRTGAVEGDSVGGWSAVAAGAPSIPDATLPPALHRAEAAVDGLRPQIVSFGSYTDIADTSQNAPGQSTMFSTIDAPSTSGSNVAFDAKYNSGNSNGIYTGVVGTAGATRIADSSTTVPGQSTTFFSFGSPVLSGSNVAFGGTYNSNQQGIYTGVAGTAGATRIADTSTTAPGQSATFTSFSNLAISGNNVVATGFYNSGNGQGLYTGVAGTAGLTRIADTSQTAPGQSTPFTSFAYPAISGSKLVFEGFYNAGTGLYTGVAGTAGATRIVDTSTTAPGQTTKFSGFGSTPAISGSNIAFTGAYNAGGGNGVYTAVAGTAGATRVTDTTQLAPGETTAFTNFYGTAISGSTVAFYATFNSGNGAGVYTAVAGQSGILRITDTSQVAPHQTTTFTGFSYPEVSGSNVAFLGEYSGGSGLFLFQGSGVSLDIAETGETLFGSTISALGLAPSGLDGNDLAFSYTLANGISGVATVVVPEPATWAGGALLGAAALGGAVQRLRRRRV